MYNNSLLSLIALPGLTKYYSKNIKIKLKLGKNKISKLVIYWYTVLLAILTSIYLYSIGVLYLTFLNIISNLLKYTRCF